MITQSVSEARRKLGHLIELARQGEDIVIIKDSKPVATLMPIDASDMELKIRLTDRQARRIRELSSSKPGISFRSAKSAVKYLKKKEIDHNS